MVSDFELKKALPSQRGIQMEGGMEQSDDLWVLLPLDMQHNIFSFLQIQHLCKLRIVSKYFYNMKWLSNQSVNFSHFAKRLNANILRDLLPLFPNLQVL
jgi:hypothetical protein